MIEVNVYVDNEKLRVVEMCDGLLIVEKDNEIIYEMY